METTKKPQVKAGTRFYDSSGAECEIVCVNGDDVTVRANLKFGAVTLPYTRDLCRSYFRNGHWTAAEAPKSGTGEFDLAGVRKLIKGKTILVRAGDARFAVKKKDFDHTISIIKKKAGVVIRFTIEWNERCVFIENVQQITKVTE
jgi:hypothetical protein